jgi:CubicO group peptidase (beta-lactamase class C family)
MIINKTKRIEIVWIKVLAIVIFVAGLLLTALNCSNAPSNDLDLKLEQSVSERVEKDKSIRNCVLAVMKGDGSYYWAGAAGIANQDSSLPMTQDTPIYTASVMKLYTATIVMKLYEDGALSLDDPISRYLPADLINGINVYKGKDYTSEITIKELLSNTSGIADYYMEAPKGGKSVFESLLEEPERAWKEDETIEWARDKLESHFPPGTAAFYSDTNFDLLGKIIESVTGKPMHTVYEDYIFHPLGLTHSWLIDRSAHDVSFPTPPADVFYKDRNITNIRSNSAYWPYLVSTAGDMLIFLKALNEGKIISKDSLQSMHDWHKLEFPLQYGYGTMYFELPPLMTKVTKLTPLWGHSGSTGSFLYYSEDLGLYMAGTIDVVDKNVTPFMLMRNVMKLIDTNGNP